MANLYSFKKHRDNFFKKLNKPLTRRQALIYLTSIFGPPLVVSTYGFGFEPFIPKIEHVTITLLDFPKALQAIHISDLHMKSDGRFMSKIRNIINSFEPDFIFITGDLVENKEEIQICQRWIDALKCKYGIFFVPGNWEHWSGTLNDDLASKLESIGVQTLNNSCLNENC